MCIKAGEKLEDLEKITVEILDQLTLTLASYEGQEVDLKEDVEESIANITALLVGNMVG